MPPTLDTTPLIALTPEPLTRTSFAPFGTAIIPPLPATVTSAPDPSDLPKDRLIPKPVVANQSSALKYSPISPLSDNYGSAASGKASEARMSMFSCFPRKLRTASATKDGYGNENGDEKKVFDVTILERHPYTTQTFSPLGLSPSTQNNNANETETYYLVIVAPTLTNQSARATSESGSSTQIKNPPDLSRLRAFVARGDMAVTYGAGTWHAPMVVLGDRKVDFLVVQFVNGVGEEDCQEAGFGEGVVVDLSNRNGGWGKVKL